MKIAAQVFAIGVIGAIVSYGAYFLFRPTPIPPRVLPGHCVSMQENGYDDWRPQSISPAINLSGIASESLLFPKINKIGRNILIYKLSSQDTDKISSYESSTDNYIILGSNYAHKYITQTYVSLYPHKPAIRSVIVINKSDHTIWELILSESSRLASMRFEPPAVPFGSYAPPPGYSGVTSDELIADCLRIES